MYLLRVGRKVEKVGEVRVFLSGVCNEVCVRVGAICGLFRGAETFENIKKLVELRVCGKKNKMIIGI